MGEISYFFFIFIVFEEYMRLIYLCGIVSTMASTKWLCGILSFCKSRTIVPYDIDEGNRDYSEHKGDVRFDPRVNIRSVGITRPRGFTKMNKGLMTNDCVTNHVI